jgi:hypothetical protein
MSRLGDLVDLVQEALDEYNEDGMSWDEDDLRDVLDRLVDDLDEILSFVRSAL